MSDYAAMTNRSFVALLARPLTLPVWKLECRTSGVLDHLVELPTERLLFLGRDLARASATQTQQLSLAPFLLTPTQHFVFEKSFSLHAIRSVSEECDRFFGFEQLCFDVGEHQL